MPTAVACTPGNSRTRWSMAKIVRRESAGSFLIRLKSNSVIKSPAATNPGLSPAALSAPLKNNPAEKSNMRESAIWIMTEICRGAKKRLTRPIRAGSPTCCLRSLTRSAFVAFNAGPRLKSMVATRQNRKVIVSTAASGRSLTTSEKLVEASK